MPTFDQTYLQASLKSHNASFDSLLRVIPAKYYLRPDSDDEEQTAKPTVRLLVQFAHLAVR